MQKIGVWRLSTNGHQNLQAEPLQSVSETETEKLLEDVLTTSPELLLPDLALVGRQLETQGGPLDLLGVDEDGRLVVFELKRGNLTRDAVAQAIDYASYLDDLETEDLCRLITQSSGKFGIDKIEDFAQWYQSQYPEQALSEIGTPRIMLVGLGVDERARRMVQYLAKCELDISLITFYGFKLGGETLLARQVEVPGPSAEHSRRATKAGNQANLERLLAALGIQETYNELFVAAKEGLGESTLQWPNTTGYTFYMRELTESGTRTDRAYLSLYAPEDRSGRIQILLHARAIDAIEMKDVESSAKLMGSSFLRKPTGWGEIWIDGRKPASDYVQPLRALAQRISLGWKAKMENSVRSEKDVEEEVPQTV